MKNFMKIVVLLLLIIMAVSCSASASSDESLSQGATPTPTEDISGLLVEEVDETEEREDIEEVCDACPVSGDWEIVYDIITLECGDVLNLTVDEPRNNEIVDFRVGPNAQSITAVGLGSPASIELGIISGNTEWVHYAGSITEEGIELNYGLSFMGPDQVSEKNILVGQITNEQMFDGLICKAFHPFTGSPVR